MCFIRIIKALVLQVVLIALISTNLYAHLAKKISSKEGTFLEYLPPGDYSHDNSRVSDYGDVKLTFFSDTITNYAPVVNTGRDTARHKNSPYIFLKGSASDNDGSISSYSWTKVSGPSATLRDVNTATLQAVNLIVGTYVFRLTVYDNEGASGYDDVKVRVIESTPPPVVNAGNDTTIVLRKKPGTTYTYLYGSGSLYGDALEVNNTLRFSWSMVSGPSEIRDDSGEIFVIPNWELVEGTYTLRLRARDRYRATAYDVMKLTVITAPNVAPVANAGNDTIALLPNNYCFITGSATDGDGTIPSYSWSKVSGPSANLRDVNTPTLQVVNLVEGTYVFRLTVSDDEGASDYDEVKLTVKMGKPVNIAPVANAGKDTTAQLPYNYSFITGSGTDNDGSISSYSWSKVSGPPASLQIKDAATLKVVNLVEGTYVFRLTVVDDDGASGFDDIKLTVKASSDNNAPVANAGNDTTVIRPINYCFITGSGTDSDGSILYYNWTKVSGPNANLRDVNTATLQVINLFVGTYIFRLSVWDNEGNSSYDDMKVTVRNPILPVNDAPVANAGNDTTAILPINYCFITGSGTDSDGSITSYYWRQVSGPNANLRDIRTQTLQVVNLREGTYIFRLRVTDNERTSSEDDVTLTVKASDNDSPVANAGNDTTAILPNNYCFITGSATDSDGTIVSYYWTKVSGPDADLRDVRTPTLQVVNLLVGTYVFRLLVSDDENASDYGDVNLTVYSSAPGSPPTNNLVAHWRLNNNAIDDSGNGFDGVLKNEAYFITQPTPTNNAVQEGSHYLALNGYSDSYVEIAKPKELPSGRSPRSISTWVDPYDVSSNLYRWIVSYGTAATSSAMSIGRRGTEIIGGAYGDDLITKNFLHNDWQHIALTYDGDTAKLYVDGILKVSEAKNWTLIPDKAYIGKQVNGSEPWRGGIDDVRIYDKALSLSEIKVLATRKKSYSNTRIASEVKERSTFKPDLKEINVYPNPTRGRFFIDIATEYYSSAEELSITLYDLMGSQVMNKKIPYQGKVDMDISGIKDAVYVYVISSGNGTLKRGKFIKDAGH